MNQLVQEQLSQQIDEIIAHCKLNREKSYALIFIVLSYIAKDHHFKVMHPQSDEALRLIMLVKSHLKNDPAFKLKMLDYEHELSVPEVDLHHKCKKQLAELQEKLKFRDQRLSETTCNYLKDLQNLREQLYRQANAGQDFYEVQYFDSFEIGDPKYLELLNSKIKMVKAQFDQRIKYLTSYIESQKKEINCLRSELNELQTKYGYYQNPEYLIRKLFFLERDPYKVWKLIQEVQGNQHLFQVFQQQKKGYGIDYKEIDKLILQTSAHDRDFENFKEILNSQVISFMERMLGETQNLKDELEARNSEIETYKRHQKKYRISVQQQVDKVFSMIYRQYNKLLLQFALLKWANRTESLGLVKQLSEFKLQIQQQPITDYLIFDISQLQDKISMLNKQLVNQKYINKQLEIRKDMAMQVVEQISKFLNVRHGTVEFEQKLLRLDNYAVRHCAELYHNLEIQNLSYERYLSNLKKESKHMQTDFHGVEIVIEKEVIYLGEEVPCQKCANQQQNKLTLSIHQQSLQNHHNSGRAQPNAKVQTEGMLDELTLVNSKTPSRRYRSKERTMQIQPSLLIDKDLIKQALESPQSNLIKQQEQLPKLRCQSQVRQELKKQLNRLNNMSFVQPEPIELERWKDSSFRSKMKKRPQVVIQIQEFPASTQSQHQKTFF